jgi:sortase (surface protein transpeptidase)
MSLPLPSPESRVDEGVGDLASPDAAGRRGRSGGWGLIVLAGAAAWAGAAVVALAVMRSSDNDDRRATPVVETAVGEDSPSTVAPLTTELISIPSDPEPPSTIEVENAIPVVTSTESPLVDLLGPTYSVIPEAVTPRARPTSLMINSIDVAAFPIREVGLEDDGQLEIPDETEIGWYKYGATAGRPGSTVLAAHVSWNQTTGPFYNLGTVEPGDEIAVKLDNGTDRRYEVTERAMYDKDQLPRERIWRTTGAETLVLITCGGDFNPEIRRFRQNIVVYAVPVA